MKTKDIHVGDRIEIVKVGSHGPILVIGDIHTVTVVSSDKRIHTNRNNVFNAGEYDEFILLLADYVDRKECAANSCKYNDDYVCKHPDLGQLATEENECHAYEEDT